MKVWIQHADYSEEEFELNLDATFSLFKDVDWTAELALEQKLAQGGEDNCPPGLGIVHPAERILHICPGPSGALVHFHYPHKVLGFLNSEKSLTLEHVRPDVIKRMIEAFFAQEWEVIKSFA